MAIYSAKHAKELILDSICLDDSSYVALTGLKIRAVLKGETKQRVFHVRSLLADGGKQEIQDLIATLKAGSKKLAAAEHTSGLEREDHVA